MTDEPRFDRRRLLAWAGGIGLAALVPGCGGDDEPATTTRAQPGTTTGQATETTAAPDCVLTPELTEGPYYLDLDLARANIAEGRPGRALDLRVTIVDAASCAPLEGAAVDVWHCDAGGVYSGVAGAEGETFCRGVQLTGADGVAIIRTIFPGWYTGRAVHVHLKVALNGTDVHTGQLFFDDATIAAVYAEEPYAARSGPDTPNDADVIFAESEGTTIVAVTPGDRYAGEVTLGVQR